MGLMTAGGGLTTSKLALANAGAGDVISGKTFYAGDKVLKTGAIPEYGYEPVIQKVGIFNPGDGDRIYFYLPNADTEQQNLGGHVTRSICAPINSVRPLVYSNMSWESYSATGFTTTKASRVILIHATANGYKGSNVTVGGEGIANILSADNCTEHSFGNWGTLHCAGYGYNIPQGRWISLGGNGADSNNAPWIEVWYFE